LKGFQRVPLQPGESKQVDIAVPLNKIKWYNNESGSWELEKMEYQAYIGSSSDEDDLIELSFPID
jgi:beta-glucosidase